MSQAAIIGAGGSSTCSAAFTRNLSTKTTSTPAQLAAPSHLKTTFQGLSLQDAKRGVSNSFNPLVKDNKRSLKRSGLEITARTAASKNIEVEVDKPLGLTLGPKNGGGVLITGIEGGGNAAKAGLKVGDQVVYTSSFFGDELWPADKLGFTKTAIQAKPDSVYFVISRGADVDVKRLPKRPAPPRFGRKLSDAQKWIYGFVVFFYSGGTPLIRKESLPWHILFGLFVYVLAVGTACLGFLEKLTFLQRSGLEKYGSEAFLVNFTAIATILFGTFVVLSALSQGPREDEYSYTAI